MYTYKHHLKCDTGLHYQDLTKENTTWLSFDKWRTFYNADIDNWEIYNHKSYYGNEDYYLPAYKKAERKNDHSYPVYQYIKFLTRRDYRKFKRFVRKMMKHGEDAENTKEILELADIIGSRATLRLEAAQEEVNKRYNLMLEQQTKATQNLIGNYISEGEIPVCIPSFNKNGNPCHEIVAFKSKEEEPKFILNAGADNISSLQLPSPLQIPEEPLVTIDLDKPEETLNNLVVVGTPNEVITLNTWRDLEKYTKADFHTGVVIYNTKENQTYIVGEDRKLRRVKG